MRLVMLAAWVILGLPGFVGAEQRQILHVGSEIGFSPYADTDTQGQSIGFSVELFAAVAAAMDIPVNFHSDPWDILWQSLKTGRIDALPAVARTTESESQAEFTQPYAIGYDSFFTRKGRDPVNSIERARAMSIIVLRSDVAHEALVSRGFSNQLIIVDNLVDGFRLLAAGQHDALLAPRLQGSALVHNIGLDKIILPSQLLSEYRREFSFAVRKGDIGLRDRLDQGLVIVKANGEYERFYRKWLGLYEEQTFAVKYEPWGVFSAAGLLMLLALWTWQLRRQVALRTAELAQANATLEQRVAERTAELEAARQEAEEARDLLQITMDNAPGPMSYVDRECRYRRVNKNYELWFGYPFEKMYGRHIRDVLGEEAWQILSPYTERALAGEQIDFELQAPYLRGGPRWVHITLNPDFSADGGVRGFVVHALDISEHKQTVAELVKAHALLDGLLTQAPVGIAYLDRELRHILVNSKLASFNGIPVASHIGQRVHDIAPPVVLPAVEEAIARMLTTGEPVKDFEISGEIPATPGTMRYWNANWYPLYDNAAEITGFGVIVEEITERKQAEEALHEADRRKDEFLAMLAHELRNPLAPISNAVQIMKRSDLDETRLAWCRDVINRQVEHLVRLVDDLLDVSRISRGKIELKKETLEVSTIVQRAIETSQPLIDARRHEFTVQLPPEPIYVEGDLVRLAQVVSNLLNNAAKYTDEGGRIKLTVEPADDDVFIRVRDNGRGIEPSALPSLFQLFYQVDRTIDRAEGGLGIGLALVKSLVAMHGGEVWASSEGRGKGSEFAIHLPCLRKSTVVATSCHIDAKPDEGPLRILVVDDNRDAAQSLSLLLTSEGHEVLLAYDGYAALEIAQAARPQVVLLDIGLPGMDGYAVARALRQDPALKMTHLIALSGYGRVMDRETARTAGFNAYLTKPIDFDELLCAMAQPLLADQAVG
ncbi:PAS domain-containing protein [Methylobacter sp. YRD-M1]|uniref:PAS domain-containing protein n=1 Tax=Methylobacter sp. YRD-M1 TaxID=2911520 RepID=UPI00227C4A08|nr:PAS domain-containing protein [Methylobacter sp. YRD-M1]WAK01271.1 PAS domain-containing protein [Methylobacter sp. YRD-M1]